MHYLGWRQGKNVEFRAAYADGRVERLDAFAKDLVEQKVEVIVVGAPQATRAAQKNIRPTRRYAQARRATQKRWK